MKKSARNLGIMLLLATFVGACSDDTTYLDKSHEDNSNSEVYAGLWGIASAVADVADQAYIVEALRGNMAEPTTNSTMEMWDIWYYRDDLQGNSLVNPAGYYNIIVNVNDYLQQVNNFRTNNPTAFNFEEMYGVSFDLFMSTAIRYKVWAYLMLAKFYGEAVYFDDPLSEYVDIETALAENKGFERLDFNGIIDKCLELMTVGQYGVDGLQETTWQTFLFPSATGDNEAWMRYDRYQFTCETLLAELYLWKGDYYNAAIQAMTEITRGGNTSNADCYMLCLRGSYNSDWKDCVHTYFRFEQVSMASYNPKQAGETNRLEDFASNESPFHYYLKPTEYAMARFDTTQVANTSNAAFTDRYRGSGCTYKWTDGGDVVLNKWINGSTQTTETVISLYRASHLHLMLCEALSGMAATSPDIYSDDALRNAFLEAALALLNTGTSTYWDASTGAYAAGSAMDVMIRYFDPSNANLYLANLYCGADHSLRSSQYLNQGVRGRVSMGYDDAGLLDTDDDGELIYSADEQCWKLDSLLAEEYFFELSGEGHTMSCLYRLMTTGNRTMNARIRTPEQKAYFAKVEAGDRSDVESKLSNESKWFIDYDLFE